MSEEGQSCEAEPLICGLWRYLQAESVRTESNPGHHAGVAELCDVWKTYTPAIRSEVVLYQSSLNITDKFLETETLSKMTHSETNFTIG